jgi:hypothetical protein
LLSSLDDRRDEVVPILLDAFHRRQAAPRQAQLLLAPMVIASRHPNEPLSQAVAQVAESQIRGGSSSERVKLAAALCLLTLRAGDMDAMLEIIRPELSSSKDTFVHLPWAEANSLHRLASDALSYNRQVQCQWILEGLQHRDTDVVRSALHNAGELNMRWRKVALPWVPALEELVHSPDEYLGSSASDSLFAIGTPGIEVLEKIASSGPGEVSKRATTTLKRVRSVSEVIVHCTRFESPPLRTPVERLVQSIGEHLTHERPGYIEAVRGAVDQLSGHGPQAREATATVLPLAEDPRFHPWLCLSAIRCLWRITNDAELVVPLVIRNLRPEPATLALIDVLREIGLPAAAALPNLQSIVEGEERLMKWGFTLDVGLMDEAFIETASKAIQAISPS